MVSGVCFMKKTVKKMQLYLYVFIVFFMVPIVNPHQLRIEKNTIFMPLKYLYLLYKSKSSCIILIYS